MTKKVRLSNHDLAALESLFHKHFLPEDKLWLFGSGADLIKKSDNIDLYIETNSQTADEAVKRRPDFVWGLEQAIGEQKN
jgi:hypothetical protein